MSQSWGPSVVRFPSNATQILNFVWPSDEKDFFDTTNADHFLQPTTITSIAEQNSIPGATIPNAFGLPVCLYSIIKTLLYLEESDEKDHNNKNSSSVVAALY